MKEQVQKTGIRTWFGDDLLDIQKEALDAIQAHYSEYGACIIKGCKISSKTISSGIVFLDGKCQRFLGATVTSFPVYLKTKMSNETREYNTGGSKDVSITYEAIVSTSIPSGEYIRIDSSGGKQFRDVFQDANHRMVSDSKISEWNSAKNSAINILRGSIESSLNTLGKLKTWASNLFATKQEVYDIKISARNLVKESDLLAWNTCEKVGFNTYTFDYNAIRSKYVENNVFPDIVFKSQTQYVFSFTFKAQVERINGWYLTIKYTDGSSQTITKPNTISYKDVLHISDKNKTISKVIFDYGTTLGGSIITLKNVSITEGNKITGWLPAPEDIQNIKIGGTNLIEDSELKNSSGCFEPHGTSLSNPTNNYLKVIAEHIDGTYGLRLKSSQLPHIPNEEYMVSFDIKAININRIVVSDYWGNSGGHISFDKQNITTDWQRVSYRCHTGKATTNWYLLMINSNIGDGFCIRNFKIEIGNKATDWNSAPADKANKNGDSSEPFEALSLFVQDSARIASTKFTSNEINTYASAIHLNWKNGDGSDSAFRSTYLGDGKRDYIAALRGETKEAEFYGNVIAKNFIIKR